VLVAFLAARTAGKRLVRTSEEALLNLRVRTFAHIHRLSIAEQSEEARGVRGASPPMPIRCSSSPNTRDRMAHLVRAGVQRLALMLVYSWRLSIVVVP
jgi:hypothetical protein